MVVGDLGNVKVAGPRQRFQEDVDMWSVRGLAAELYARRPLFDPEVHAEQSGTPAGNCFLDAITAIVGGSRPRGLCLRDASPRSRLVGFLAFL